VTLDFGLNIGCVEKRDSDREYPAINISVSIRTARVIDWFLKKI
jgi:hypothetical protein